MCSLGGYSIKYEKSTFRNCLPWADIPYHQARNALRQEQEKSKSKPSYNYNKKSLYRGFFRILPQRAPIQSPLHKHTPLTHSPCPEQPPPPSHPPPHPLRQPHHTGASPEEGTRRETETCVSPTPLPCPPPPPPRAPQGPHPPPSPPPLLQAYPPQREGGRPVGSWTDRGDHFFFPSASRCSQK